MYKMIVISLLLFASVSKIRASKAGAKRKPYVLAEFDDDKAPTKRRYEYPTCAVKDETKDDVIFSASGEESKMQYFCYPVRMETCAFASGKYMNNYCAFDRSPKCGVDGNYEYVMKKELDSKGDEITCARPESNAKLYRVGYNFEFIADEPFKKDVYKFCYDNTNEKTLYAEYKIISPNLLGNPDVDDRAFHEEVETSPFDKKELGDFAKKKAYFTKVSKPNSELAFRNLVVPPSHMAMDWWKEPLYHIINQQILRPKFHTEINLINDYIRDEAKQRLGEVFIRTGVMDMFDFTYEASIWWKLIYDERRKYAIALFIHNIEEPPGWLPCGNENGENTCLLYGWQKIVPSTVAKFVHCCTPHYLVDLFNFDPVKTFDLKNLPENEYAGRKKDCKIPPKTDTQIHSLNSPPVERQILDDSFRNTNIAVEV